jgi:hypothetical protein
VSLACALHGSHLVSSLVPTAAAGELCMWLRWCLWQGCQTSIACRCVRSSRETPCNSMAHCQEYNLHLIMQHASCHACLLICPPPCALACAFTTPALVSSLVPQEQQVRYCLVLVSLVVSAGTPFSGTKSAMQSMGPVSDSLQQLLLLVKQACSNQSAVLLRHQECMQQSAA